MDDTLVAPKSATGNSAPILHELAERASRLFRRSIEDWLACARIVREAREIAEHGQLRAFLRDAGIPERTARRMLRFARAGIQSGHLAALTQGEIAGLIAVSERMTAAIVAAAPEDGDPWRLSRAEMEARRRPDDGRLLVEVVIEEAQGYGYDPGEFARFVIQFPNLPLPKAAA